MDYGNRISYLVLEPGTDCLSSDGQRVGKVQQVLADADADIFDGLVIDIQSGPGGLRFVDAPEVGDIYERAVVLSISADEVESLPKY